MPGHDRRCLSTHPPSVTGPLHAGHRGTRVHARPRAHRGTGEAARKRKRIDMTSGRIAPTTMPIARTGEFCNLVRIEQFDRRAAALPLLETRHRDARDAARCVRRLQPAVLHRIAVDAVAPDQIERELRRVAYQRDQRLALVRAASGDNRIRIGAGQARDYLPVVAPGTARADFCRLQQHDIGATLGCCERGRKAGVACADHQHIGVIFTGRQRASSRSCCCGGGPESGRPHGCRELVHVTPRRACPPRGETRSARGDAASGWICKDVCFDFLTAQIE